MAICARLQWLSMQITTGHAVQISLSLQGSRLRLRCVVDPSVNVTPTHHRAVLVGVLSAVSAHSSIMLSVDRGHKFTSGRSEVCVWMDAPKPLLDFSSPCEDNDEGDDGSGFHDGSDPDPKNKRVAAGNGSNGADDSCVGGGSQSCCGSSSLPSKRPRQHALGCSDECLEPFSEQIAQTDGRLPWVPPFPIPTNYLHPTEYSAWGIEEYEAVAASAGCAERPVYSKSVHFVQVPDVYLFEPDGNDVTHVGDAGITHQLHSLEPPLQQFIEACHQQFLSLGELEAVYDYAYVADPAARECLLLLQFRHFELRGASDLADATFTILEHHLRVHKQFCDAAVRSCIWRLCLE